MEWLTAILAFATTMLIFAIIVSTLVETIHRIWGLRGQGMSLMLENLYERAIAPKLPPADRVQPAEFARIIMENRAVAPVAGQAEPGRLSKLTRWLIDSSVMTDMPVEVFTQKLADNRLVRDADALTDDVIKDFGQKFEAFGKEMSTAFERRARLFSVIVAFFVAWMFYIHPYNIATTYIKNPELAQRVADKAADVHADYRALVERLNATADEQPAPEGSKELREAIAKLDEQFKSARAEAVELQKIGVPLGWPSQDKMRPCGWGLIASDCKFVFLGASWTKPSVSGAFWLLVGGLLVGLGAPFWAQAVASLSATRDVSRRIADIVAPNAPVATRKAVAPSVVLEAAARRAEPVSASVAAFRMAASRPGS